MDDDYEHDGIVNCKTCGKKGWWEKRDERWVLIDYKTEQPQQCPRAASASEFPTA